MDFSERFAHANAASFPEKVWAIPRISFVSICPSPACFPYSS
ncbi:hypothetical protein HMPREF9061_01115 [Actinomyces sp. oral taxon 181 str. F0379]|nr:hypothetical protein HMPREF9061_01115 [Actinomyces sp. oral taxon 181 str. F0379]